MSVKTYLSPRARNRKLAVYDLALGLPAWLDVCGGKNKQKTVFYIAEAGFHLSISTSISMSSLLLVKTAREKLMVSFFL